MKRATTRARATASVLLSGTVAMLSVLVGPAGPAHAADQNYDLWAKTATITLPNTGATPLSVQVWGYAPTDTAITAPGGPTLYATVGQTVQITLHNGVGEPSSLLIQGQGTAPDRAGAPVGGTETYNFTADRAGTYLYEAGLRPNAQHQVAMGLYGALVVRPANAGRAYPSGDTDVSTAFDDEAVLVLGEIDPALNNAANKAAFDMRKYAPRYFLVNGKVYPNTAPIPTTAGKTVLLRYVNAGSQYRSMGVLGQHQTLVGLDGSPLKYARHAVAETFGPGQSADALVAVPDSTADAKLAVFDNSLLLHNTAATGNAAGIGGMLTTIDAAAPAPPVGGFPDTAGPGTRNVAYDATAHTLSAIVDDSATGGSNVVAAEYFVDTVGAPGSGTAMTGTFGTPTVTDVTADVTLTGGEHVLYVRGRDATAPPTDPTDWGPLSSVLVSGGDAGGPATKFPSLTPRLVNHNSTGVAVHATGDDSATGGSNIKSAEYFIDLDPSAPPPANGSGAAMAVNQPAPIASLDATILPSVVNALVEGPHVVSIHAMDSGDNWGDMATIELVVDATGPDSSGVTVSPNPSNGLIAFGGGTPSVRVMATTLADPVINNVNSTIKSAEVFIDTAGASGTGIPMTSSDGAFNDAQEGGYADIPLTTIRALSNGTHNFLVHAKDAAGNWGPMSAPGTLVVDKLGPTVSAVAATPNPTLGAPSVTLTATATDTLSQITKAEWFMGTDPGVGNATAMTQTGTGPASLSATVSTQALSEGAYTLRVRAKDAAGNWGSTASTVLNVSSQLYFSTEGNTNPPGVPGTADDADIYFWNGATFSRFIDASGTGSLLNLPAGANVDGYDRVDDTHFYLSFSTDTTVPGLGAVQDEDVVYYNAGTWSVFFDGTAHGMTPANLDLDAISIVGGTLYFSTFGNTNPPGVGGTADDADIYRYNGGNSYTRVWDATVNGLAATANVDGLALISSTDFYLSFSTTTVAVPGLGNVQDEDVVRDNNGGWTIYFDGTGKGLTATAQDVDAFDVP